MSRDRGKVHLPGAVLDEEQHGQAAQEHGASVEEAGRHDGRGLGLQECPPGLPGPPGRGAAAGVFSGSATPRRRNLVAQAGQLAVDAPVSPARVIAGHRQHQRPYGPSRPGPPGSAAREGPLPPDEVRVPAQQARGEMIRRSWRSCRAGSRRASAARTARPAHHSRGALACRESTPTCWRKIRISASLARSDRASRAGQPNTRSTARQASRSDTSTQGRAAHRYRAARHRTCPALIQEKTPGQRQ